MSYKQICDKKHGTRYYDLVNILDPHSSLFFVFTFFRRILPVASRQMIRRIKRSIFVSGNRTDMLTYLFTEKVKIHREKSKMSSLYVVWLFSWAQQYVSWVQGTQIEGESHRMLRTLAAVTSHVFSWTFDTLLTKECSFF